METAMRPKTVASDPQRHPKFESIYDLDTRTGATIEVFYADRVLTGTSGAGWHWWKSRPGDVPEWPPVGPFATSYRALKDAIQRGAHATFATRR
jgi:hypothetical protein